MDCSLHARKGKCFMAIDPASKTLREYKQYYYRKVILVLLSASACIILGLGIALHFTAISIFQLNFWIIILITAILQILFSISIVKIIAAPLNKILAALSHKIGELTTDTPPNPNDKRYEKTGFKTALQAIYGDYQPEQKPANDNDKPKIPLTQALNQASTGVVILNSNQKIIFANSSAPISRNAKGEDFLALDFLNEPSISDWLHEISNEKIKAERRWQRISTNPDIIQKTRIFDIVASFEKGAAAETVIFLIDKSKGYLPEEEDLNFISFAAHELRGPITVIRGYLDIINEEFAGRLQGDERQLLDRLVVSSNRLSSYIDNILNVARYDRHHLKVYLLEDTVANIYASIADDMQLRASTQHRLLNVNIPNDLPTVAADHGSIGEVIGNLIDNAIKYSFEGGSVTVSAEQKGDFVEVSVADNGIGMPANVVDNLFHKFYRSHRSREAVAGTGIGLYICKAFVESHGGSIIARSRENEGSVFSFTLPIYATVKDKLLEDGQLNNQLIRKGGGWIKNHAMYKG